MNNLLNSVIELLEKEFNLEGFTREQKDEVYKSVARKIIKMVCQETKAKTLANGEQIC